MDSEVPKPCRHFLGRDKELEELYTMLEENRHVFLCGIAGIGKSELAKAYAKQYKKHYTNILYVEYTGDLHQDITDMDFIDDLPESTEQERFQRHNRFLRSLKSDTLLIIDNFNVTATQDSFLSVVLKYRCQILFTTRSNLNEYCTFQLKEIQDINILFQLTSAFYSEADKYRSTVEKIIETVHYHTFAVELAAKLLENGISTPGQLLAKLQEERASLDNEDKIKIIKEGQSSKATYYSHIHTLFSLYALSRKQQEPERGISELQKLSGIIKEYHSDGCLDYAKVQETLGTIYLMTANLPQAKTHFKRAFKIYEKIWADEPEMIEAKYQEIQELYPQIGFCIEKNLSGL